MLKRVKEKMKSPFEGIIDSKLLRILNYLTNSRTNLFHIQNISINSKVPIATTFRIVKKLHRLKFLKTTIIGKTKLYSLEKNSKTKFFKKSLRN